jgi:hypothetical protein
MSPLDRATTSASSQRREMSLISANMRAEFKSRMNSETADDQCLESGRRNVVGDDVSNGRAGLGLHVAVGDKSNDPNNEESSSEYDVDTYHRIIDLITFLYQLCASGDRPSCF